MMFPPSLAEDAKARAFRASNGELGVLPADVAAFLAACRSDCVGLLGWELWIVDHRWDAKINLPKPEPGVWSGGVPVPDNDVPAIFAGDGDVDETERQIGSIDFLTAVRRAWLQHVRVNFTLED